jgi:hypothetical protein
VGASAIDTCFVEPRAVPQNVVGKLVRHERREFVIIACVGDQGGGELHVAAVCLGGALVRRQHLEAACATRGRSHENALQGATPAHLQLSHSIGEGRFQGVDHPFGGREAVVDVASRAGEGRPVGRDQHVVDPQPCSRRRAALCQRQHCRAPAKAKERAHLLPGCARILRQIVDREPVLVLPVAAQRRIRSRQPVAYAHHAHVELAERLQRLPCICGSAPRVGSYHQSERYQGADSGAVQHSVLWHCGFVDDNGAKFRGRGGSALDLEPATMAGSNLNSGSIERPRCLVASRGVHYVYS